MSLELSSIEGLKDYFNIDVVYHGLHTQILHAKHKTTNEPVYIKVLVPNSYI